MYSSFLLLYVKVTIVDFFGNLIKIGFFYDYSKLLLLFLLLIVMLVKALSPTSYQYVS